MGGRASLDFFSFLLLFSFLLAFTPLFLFHASHYNGWGKKILIACNNWMVYKQDFLLPFLSKPFHFIYISPFPLCGIYLVLLFLYFLFLGSSSIYAMTHAEHFLTISSPDSSLIHPAPTRPSTQNRRTCSIHCLLCGFHTYTFIHAPSSRCCFLLSFCSLLPNICTRCSGRENPTSFFKRKNGKE